MSYILLLPKRSVKTISKILAAFNLKHYFSDIWFDFNVVYTCPLLLNTPNGSHLEPKCEQCHYHKRYSIEFIYPFRWILPEKLITQMICQWIPKWSDINYVNQTYGNYWSMFISNISLVLYCRVMYLFSH